MNVTMRMFFIQAVPGLLRVYVGTSFGPKICLEAQRRMPAELKFTASFEDVGMKAIK